ncbi:MAG TPA: GntR family transcriptional regulator [Sphingobacterium sp.]|nr:GntR family transcriptional regulator [Sphingobacterium sp.]
MKKEIKKNSGVLHKQAEVYLRRLIEKDEYKNGKLLPSEVELAKELNISRNTLRQAINKLVFEGLLFRKRGYGTQVIRKGIVGGIKNWLSFSQEMKMLGIEVRNFELHVRYKQPPIEVGNFFELHNEEEKINKILLMERVRGNTEYPFVYFVSYFNPDIPISSEENFNRPLYEILEKDFNVIVKTSKEEIFARLAGDFIAHKLDIKANDPILVRKRLVYDKNDTPVEYNIGYYKADSFTYRIEAER